MIKGHKIVKKINIKNFLDNIKDISLDHIHCTDHTFFRLSGEQRKLFKCEDIKGIILGNMPLLVGIQHNGLYAIFYNRDKNTAFRLILDIQFQKIDVVTFYVINKIQIPNI